MKRFFYTFLSLICMINLADAQMVITGVFDGPLSGGTPKGVELYVTADIPDASIWGFGSANNGQGTDGVEFMFPGGSYSAGDYIYVSNEEPNFAAFFGFNPDFTHDASNINGDDAIELFLNGVVVDIFGDIDVDGTGQPWEHLNGWAARNPETGPDGMTFVLGNWNFSGIDQLTGGNTNGECTSPYPLRSYTGALPPADVDVEVRSNVFDPADITITVGDDVEWTNVGGTHNINGSLAAYPGNPEGFDNGAAAPAPWTFRHRFTIPGVYNYHCDPHVGLGMRGTVTVEEETGPEYTPTTIAVATTENGDGVADSLGMLLELTGVVHTVNFRPAGLEFTLIDAGNNGIQVFLLSGDAGYTPTQGDDLTVQGAISQFRGLTQIGPDNIVVNSSGNSLNTALNVSDILGEDTESKLIKVVDLVYDSTNGSNVHMHNTDGAYVVRVDGDTQIDITTLEQSNMEYDVTGVGGQFASSTMAPFTDGYQMFPSLSSDITSRLINSTNNVDLSADIKIYPSLTTGALNYESSVALDRIVIRDGSGRPFIEMSNVRSRDLIDVSQLASGFHTITFMVDGQQWTTRFVKQ